MTSSNPNKPSGNIFPLRFQRPTDFPDLAIFPDTVNWTDITTRKNDPLYMYNRPIILREEHDSEEDEMEEDLAVLSGRTQNEGNATSTEQQQILHKKQQKQIARDKAYQIQYENQVLTFENHSHSMQCMGRLGNLDLSAAQGLSNKPTSTSSTASTPGNKSTKPNTTNKEFKYVVFEFVNREEYPGGVVHKEINVTPIEDAYVFRKHQFQQPDLLLDEIEEMMKQKEKNKLYDLKKYERFIEVFVQRKKEADLRETLQEENPSYFRELSKQGGLSSKKGKSVGNSLEEYAQQMLFDKAFSMGSQGSKGNRLGKKKGANRSDEMGGDYDKMFIGDLGYSEEDLKNPEWIGGDFNVLHADDEEHNVSEEQEQANKATSEELAEQAHFEEEDDIKEEDLDDESDVEHDEEGNVIQRTEGDNKTIDETKLLKEGSGFVTQQMLSSIGQAVSIFIQENEGGTSSNTKQNTSTMNKSNLSNATTAMSNAASTKHALSDSPTGQPAAKKVKFNDSTTSSSTSSLNASFASSSTANTSSKASDYYVDEASVYRFIVERGGCVLLSDIFTVSESTTFC